jgi:hypothetical protein
MLRKRRRTSRWRITEPTLNCVAMVSTFCRIALAIRSHGTSALGRKDGFNGYTVYDRHVSGDTVYILIGA